MGQVLVRNLDAEVIEAIRLMAERKGHSLEQELCDILKAASPLTPRDRVALSRKIRGLQSKPAKLDSTDVIRAARDTRCWWSSKPPATNIRATSPVEAPDALRFLCYLAPQRSSTMADVHIELDDGLIRSLQATADLKGRTLEEELRDIISRAAPLTPQERVALSDRIRAKQAKPSDLASEDLMREDRNAR